jgi:hypothetical protein
MPVNYPGCSFLQKEGVSLMRGLLVAFLLILAVFIHVLSLGKASEAFKKLSQDDQYSFVLPSPMMKIASLEYQGLASDILFLKSMIFMGGTFERKERPRVKEWEWKWLINVLDNATDLDPYFFDPYFFANAFLPWDAGMTEDANKLLEKGSRYRDWDWMPPFFIGFNYFYFLQDDSRAAEFLMEASRRPGGDPMLASIASRLAFKENRTETAIYFLEQTARNTEDKNLKYRFETRIKALRSVLLLEQAVSAYKKKFGKTPSTVDDLVNRKILVRLPVDPYGGTYYIAQDGRIKSTTSSELEPYLPPSVKSRR